MSGVTLQDAQQKFSAALHDLWQSNLAAFELWLKGASDKRMPARADIDGQIASSRRKLAAEFIDRATAIAETLNAGAGARIRRQLAEFATLGELPGVPDATSPGPASRWSGALRTALGAALGAAAVLLLLAALATNSERARPAAVPAPVPTAAPAQPATSPTHGLARLGNLAAPAARGDAGPAAPPGPPADHSGAAPNAKPQPPTPVRNGARRGAFGGVLWGALAVVIGAFGAAIGAFATAMPARPRGAPAKRGPLGGIAIAAVTLGAAGLAGQWLAGAGPWWDALLAVAAALAVWLVRALWPGDAATPASEPAGAVAALERQLGVDSAIWTALASGLVLGSEGGDGRAKELDQVRAVILAHRDRGADGEEILRVVEQELHLPIGPRDTAAAGAAPASADFTWSPRHAREFDTFGIIEPGDPVHVKIPPQTIIENGATRIIKKGVVVRKS